MLTFFITFIFIFIVKKLHQLNYSTKTQCNIKSFEKLFTVVMLPFIIINFYRKFINFQSQINSKLNLQYQE